MLPYLQVQLAYVLASALALAALDRFVGWRMHWARCVRARAVVVALGLAVPLLAWALAVRAIDHSHTTYQFASVAIGFYAITLWLPALTAWRALRAAPDRPALLACIAAFAVGQYALWVEPDRLVTRTYEIAFPQWEPGAALRVVHVSDLQTVGECARERAAARRINELHPDLIVVTGDYVAGPFFDPEPAISAARRFFGELERPRFGIVCVPGHSESERLRRRIFDGLDVHYLCNEMLELELDPGRHLRIFGTRTLLEGFDLGSLDQHCEPGVVTLVASHEPDVSWELERRGVDLHLAGHTHGGQIALPWFGAPLMLSELPRRFARGLHAFGDHWLHVSAGIGMEGNHAPRIRFACPPEIDLLVLDGGGSPRLPAAPPPRS